MGGSPARVIKKTISKVTGGGGGGSPSATSQIEDRRTVGGRKRRNVSTLANYAPSTQLGETASRNPRDTKNKLGA